MSTSTGLLTSSYQSTSTDQPLAAHTSISSKSPILNTQATTTLLISPIRPLANAKTKSSPQKSKRIVNTNSVRTATVNDESSVYSGKIGEAVGEVTARAIPTIFEEIRKCPRNKKVIDKCTELANTTFKTAVETAAKTAAIMAIYENSPQREKEDAIKRMLSD